MTELPDPLVPAECDLRGLQWMPYYGAELHDSDFNSSVSDAGYRAAHNLWWACWHQVPAASLPADDRILTRLADLGRDVKRFKKLKIEALHAFLLCNDGRFYHRFLSKLAIDTFKRQLSARNRKIRWLANRVLVPIENASENAHQNALRGVLNGSGDAKNRPSARATEDRRVYLPSDLGVSEAAIAYEVYKHDAEVNGKPVLEFNEFDSGPFGRSAPLLRSAPPLRGKALKEHRKAQLVSKVMRFAIATMNERDRAAAIEGLTGLDNEHSAQWWLDTLDLKMRGARWDDTE